MSPSWIRGSNGRLASVMALILLAAGLAVAQPGAGQADPAALLSLVQAASAASTYAQGAADLAESNGLTVSSAISLIASGNASLAVARTALNPGGDLAAGLVAVHEAMANFTAAASAASKSIQDAGFAPSLDVQAASDSLSSLNQSISSASAAITQTCAATTVAGSLSLQFAQDCAAAKASIGDAEANLASASALLASIKAGSPGASPSSLAGHLSDVGADVTQADSELAAISVFTYPSRGEAFVSGPLGAVYSAANASAKLEGSFVGWFDADVSGYQGYLASRAQVANGITASASTASTAVSAVSMASVTSSIAAQQSTLSSILTNLQSFSNQVNLLPIPSSLISTLLSDTYSTETSLNSYSSAMSTLSSSAGGFPSITVNGFSTYLAGFNSASNSEAASAAAFSSSFSTLQTEVGTFAQQFPLITSLATWSSTFAQEGTSSSSGASQVAQSVANAYSAGQTLSSDLASLASSVGGVAQVEVSSALVQNVSSVYASDSRFLNSTAVASLSTASSSVQSDAHFASGFATSSRALLTTTVGNLASASQSLGAQSSGLSASGQQTSASMSSASLYVKADFDARAQTMNSARSLISQALAAFDSGQVAQGASLSSRAYSQMAAAYPA